MDLVRAVSIRSESTQYVYARVDPITAGVHTDPTPFTVEFAFTASVDTTPTSWSAGGWVADTTTLPYTYYARVLVGPAGVVLIEGEWAVWCRITATPEVVVEVAGILTVT